jgi:hypothetical protein
LERISQNQRELAYEIAAKGSFKFALVAKLGRSMLRPYNGSRRV